MALSIHLDLREVTRGLEALQMAFRRGGYKQDIGGRVQRQIQDHLRGLESSRPNRLGGRRTHFWAKAAQATFFEVQDDGVVVSINQQGMRQRFEGGTLKPVHKKWLTIPIRAEAHGRRAGEFNDLRFVQLSRGTAMLVQADQTQVRFRKRKGGIRVQKGEEVGGLALFLLKKSVTQRPDPSVLPTEQQILDESRLATRLWIDRQVQRGGFG
jgi:hypothetical protein